MVHEPTSPQLSLFPEEEADGGEPNAIAELFRLSGQMRSGRQWAELMDFLARFPRYSTFNNLLIFIQNPQVTLYATPGHWERSFHRRPQAGARPLVILAPHHSPVAFVYDLADTEGPPLDSPLTHPFNSRGEMTAALLVRSEDNCRRCRIEVRLRPSAFLAAPHGVRAGGTLTGGPAGRRGRAKFTIDLDDGLDIPSRYAGLTHELAHVLLGHLGRDLEDDWWPERGDLPRRVSELEAEAVSWLVCRRRGLHTRPAEALASRLGDERELGLLDLPLLVKTADLIERMSERRTDPPRTRGSRAAAGRAAEGAAGGGTGLEPGEEPEP